MRMRFVAALITFLLGIIVTGTVLLRGKGEPHQNDAPLIQDKQELVVKVPNARWEPIFFRSLTEHMQAIDLPSLRTVEVPEGDLETRLWIDALPNTINGIIIKRSGGQWSAVHLSGTHEYKPFRVEQRLLAPPKAGWEGTWQKLINANILTLPDASEVPCQSEAIDGVSYVVEINMNKIYRTYNYSNPQVMKCNEAEQILMIRDIIVEDFGIWDHNDSK